MMFYNNSKSLKRFVLKVIYSSLIHKPAAWTTNPKVAVMFLSVDFNPPSMSEIINKN